MTFELCTKSAWEFGQVSAGADGEFFFVFFFWSSRCFGGGIVGEVLLVRINCRVVHGIVHWGGCGVDESVAGRGLCGSVMRGELAIRIKSVVALRVVAASSASLM